MYMLSLARRQAGHGNTIYPQKGGKAILAYVSLRLRRYIFFSFQELAILFIPHFRSSAIIFFYHAMIYLPLLTLNVLCSLKWT